MIHALHVSQSPAGLSVELQVDSACRGSDSQHTSSSFHPSSGTVRLDQALLRSALVELLGGEPAIIVYIQIAERATRDSGSAQ